jgi:peroxiredoxin
MFLNHSSSVPSVSEAKRFVWRPVSILTLLLIVSVAMNIMFSQRVTHLRGAIAILKEEGQLKIGASLPAFEVNDIDGSPTTISYAGTSIPTVLYVMSPQCAWCKRNVENIKFLAKNTRDRYRFIGLSLSENNLRDYLSRNDLGFPVYTNLSRNTQSVYKLGGTPQTIVVSADGRVQKKWMGAYADDVQREIEEYFHTRLPGLLVAKQ